MSPVFRDRDRHHDRSGGNVPDTLRMVLDDETVERLRAAAASYGLEVEELMVALLQAASERMQELLGDPPEHINAN